MILPKLKMKVSILMLLALICAIFASFAVAQKSNIPSNDDLIIKEILIDLGTVHQGFWLSMDSTIIPERDILFDKKFAYYLTRDSFHILQEKLHKINERKIRFNLDLSYVNDTDLSKINLNDAFSILYSNDDSGLSILRNKFPGLIGLITYSQIAYSENKKYAYLSRILSHIYRILYKIYLLQDIGLIHQITLTI